MGRCQVPTAEAGARPRCCSRKDDSPSFLASLLIVLRVAAEHLQGNAK